MTNAPYPPASDYSPTPEEVDHTPLTFGQYRSMTPSEIAEVNPKYLVWVYDTIKNRGPLVSELLYRECQAAPTQAPRPRAMKTSAQSTERRFPPPDGSQKQVRRTFDPYDPEDDASF